MSQTVVLKVGIHCDGCKKKLDKVLRKIKGVNEWDIDAEEGKVTVSGYVDPVILLKTLRKKINKSAELLSSVGGNDDDPSDPPPENNVDEEEEADEADGGGENGVDMPYIPMIHLGPPGYLQEGIPAPKKFSRPNIHNYRRPPVHYTDPCTSMFSDENPNACSIM